MASKNAITERQCTLSNVFVVDAKDGSSKLGTCPHYLGCYPKRQKEFLATHGEGFRGDLVERRKLGYTHTSHYFAMQWLVCITIKVH